MLFSKVENENILFYMIMFCLCPKKEGCGVSIEVMKDGISSDSVGRIPNTNSI
jgi:hypothetical protein